MQIGRWPVLNPGETVTHGFLDDHGMKVASTNPGETVTHGFNDDHGRKVDSIITGDNTFMVSMMTMVGR